MGGTRRLVHGKNPRIVRMMMMMIMTMTMMMIMTTMMAMLSITQLKKTTTLSSDPVRMPM